MKSHGIEVHAMSSPGKELEKFLLEESADVHALKMSREITPWKDLNALRKLVKLLRNIKPAIVHAHTPKGGLLGMIGAAIVGVPVRIYHIHGLPLMTATGLKRKLLKWCDKLACTLAHQILCVSNSIREVIIFEGICHPDKVKVLRSGSINGIDAIKKFNPAHFNEKERHLIRMSLCITEGSLVFGFVGRLVKDKGLIELAQAWNTLRKEFSELHLLVVGPLELNDPVSPHIEQALRGDDRVHFTGWVDDLPPLYAAMDVLAFPTYREGFGLVAAEAAAMEIPVVATRIPGVNDAVIDNVTGLLVPPRDAQALTEALRLYLSAPNLRRTHGVAARKRVLKDFGQKEMWNAVHSEYMRLLKQKGLCSPSIQN